MESRSNPYSNVPLWDELHRSNLAGGQLFGDGDVTVQTPFANEAVEAVVARGGGGREGRKARKAGTKSKEEKSHVATQRVLRQTTPRGMMAT